MMGWEAVIDNLDQALTAYRQCLEAVNLARCHADRAGAIARQAEADSLEAQHILAKIRGRAALFGKISKIMVKEG